MHIFHKLFVKYMNSYKDNPFPPPIKDGPFQSLNSRVHQEYCYAN